MPPLPHRPTELAWQVFRGSDVIRRGLLTRHQLRGASWLRLRHDVYADARLDRDHALACRAALLRLPPGTLIAGPSAAYLHGVEHAAGFADDVHVLLPASARADAQPGIRVHRIQPEQRQGHFPPAARPDILAAARVGGPSRPDARPVEPPPAGSGAPARVGGPSRPDARPVGPLVAESGPAASQLAPVPRLASRPASLARTDPGRCAWETAVWTDPVRAVGIIDGLLGRGLVSGPALAELAERNRGRPGGRRASWVFGLTDPGAQSAPESHLRVRLMLAGLPRPVAQHPVRLPSGLLLHPDLAWPEHRVAVEYDGRWHVDPDQLHRDRQRLNQFVAAGWLVLHVTSRRLHREFPAVVREVRAALVARGWRA